VEVGVTEALQTHFSRTVHQRKAVSQRRLDLEHSRPRWLRECLAEATGVFFYVFPGIAAIASFTLATASPVGMAVGVPAFGSLFQVRDKSALTPSSSAASCASASAKEFTSNHSLHLDANGSSRCFRSVGLSV
jgi:hypothetical protein